MNKSIYYCENEIEQKDQLPKGLISRLKKEFPEINFIHFDPNEELTGIDNEIMIIDTIHGIKHIRIFENMQNFYLSPRISMHDYDLPIHLGLMKKLGKIKKVIIIGIPANYKISQTYPILVSIIASIGI